MNQYAENTSQLASQITADVEVLKKALRQERELAALAREETESFRHQLHKLKTFLREAQKEAKDARDQAAVLQAQLAEIERQAQGQKLHASAQLDQTQRQASIVEAENATYKLRLEKLAAILREKEKKIADLQQYELSFRKVSEQKAQHDAAVEKHLSQAQTMEQELASSNRQLDVFQQHVKQLEEAVRALQEEKQAGQSAQAAMQAQMDALQTDAAALRLELDEAAGRQNQLEAFLQSVQAESLDELRIRIDSQQEQLAAALAAAEDKQALQAENAALQESLAQAKGAQNDAEVQLKTAHQHLAKKVKETAELNDKVQFQQEQLHEQQSQLNQSRLRTAELQQTLDAHLQQEKLLQEQLQQSARAMEALSIRWEEKYFKIYEKWQEGEVRIKEMKKLEDKCLQMQSLLANIGGVFGVPLGTPVHHVPQPVPAPVAAPAPKAVETWANQRPVVESFSALVTASLPPAAEENHQSDMVPEQPARLAALAVDEDDAPSLALHSSPHADSVPFALHTSLHTGTDGQPPAAVHADDAAAKGPYQNLFDMPKPTKRPRTTLFD